MIRYIRLYLYFIRFAFSKAMEFRIDFFFRVVMDLNFYLVQYLFFSVLYLHTVNIGGWDSDQIKIFMGSVFFVDALYMSVFANGCWQFPIMINQGQLDYYLTKPISTLFFTSLREFAANSFLNLVIASMILIGFIYNYKIEFSTIRLFFYIILLINGAILYFLLHLLFLLAVFWTGSPRGYGDLFFTAQKTFERPDRIYQGYIQKFFIYILPFSLIASYPTRFLIEDNPFEIFLVSIGVCLGLFLVILKIWNTGLKNYSSASS